MAKGKKLLKEIKNVLKKHDCNKKINLFVCAAGFELLMTMPYPIISYVDLKENCGERILKMVPNYLDEHTWIEVNDILIEYMGRMKPKMFIKATRTAANKLSKKYDDVKDIVITDLQVIESHYYSKC